MYYKRCLCVEIGNYNIKIVLYRKLLNKEIVEKCMVFRTPENSITDGKINKIEALTEIITKKLNESLIKVKDVVFTVSGTSIITREVLLPKANEKELKSMIEMNSTDYIPVNLSNYILDFKVLKEIITEEAKQVKVLLVAAPKILVERYIQLAENCGLNILAIDYSGNSFYKAIQREITWRKAANGIDVGTYAIIDIGAQTTAVTIVSEGGLEFYRMLLYGSQNFDIAISQRYGVEREKAESLKVNSNNIMGFDEASAEQNVIRDSIRGVLIIMSDDISKFFQYYSSRKTGNKIDMIYTIGCGSLLKGLEDYFQNSFGIQTKKLENYNFIKIKEQKNNLESNFDLGVCIGAAL